MPLHFKNLTKLLQTLETIDQEAADYLREHAYTAATIINLQNLLVWSYTPQGHTYWADLDEILTLLPEPNDFEVGELIEIIPNRTYYFTKGGQTGTIRYYDKLEDYFYINFDTSTEHWANMTEYDKKNSNHWAIKKQYIKKISVQDHRNPVERKIRKLWNNSNWVKANPSQAY